MLRHHSCRLSKMYLTVIIRFLVLVVLPMVCCQQRRGPYCYRNYCLFNNLTYVYHYQELNFLDANEICKTTGGQLAAIRDKDINTFVNNMRKHASFYGYWIDVIYWPKQRSSLPAYSGWARDVAKRGVAASDANHRPYLDMKFNLDWSTAEMNSLRLPYICEYSLSTHRTGVKCSQEKCYEIIHALGKYPDAENSCTSHGGKLAVVDSINTHEFLKSFITERRKWMNVSDEITIGFNDKNYNVKDSWVGIHRVYPQWMFEDGTFVKYINWNDEQPDNTAEECIEMWYNNGFWNNENCDKPQMYCCEVPHANMNNATCQDGFCYSIYIDLLTYRAAADSCKRKRAKLCEIKSEETNTFINGLKGLAEASDIWIGITRVPAEYQYSDGTPATFDNWAQTDPKQRTTTCPIIDKETYKWKDGNCDSKYTVICEYVGAEWTAFY